MSKYVMVSWKAKVKVLAYDLCSLAFYLISFLRYLELVFIFNLEQEVVLVMWASTRTDCGPNW